MRRIFVFNTSKYEEEAKRHSETKVIERFKNDNNEHDLRCELNQFTENKYIEKASKNFRHIYTYRDYTYDGTDVRIYVFLRVMPRGSEYNKVFNRECSENERAKKTGISELDWSIYENEVKKYIKWNPVIGLKRKLSKEESFFIEKRENINHKLKFFPIFEMSEWVNCVERASGFRWYEEARAKIEEYCIEHLNDTDSHIFEIIIGYDDKKIVGYQQKRIEKESNENEKNNFAFYLFSIIDSNVELRYTGNYIFDVITDGKFKNFSIKIAKDIEKYYYENKTIINDYCYRNADDSIKQINDLVIGEKKITGYYENFEYYLCALDVCSKNVYYIPSIDSAIAIRGYSSSFLLYNKDWWREMEQDQKSNFVLTDSELDLVSSTVEFPLFIRGYAGSGKTTVLQYLFAEMIIHYFRNRLCEKVLPPVYISYNKELIDNAIDFSDTLFSATAVYKEELKKNSISYAVDIKPHMGEYYCVFQKVAEDCIKGTAADTRFVKEKRITFSKFNMMWEKKFGKIRDAKKKYGPSLSWHVIRTYIKGWDKDYYMGPSDYAFIGNKNKSVKDTTFSAIYSEVWEKWYKNLLDQGFWDDQDLIRYCLAPGDDSIDTYVQEKYSAVFCDEAQDFTRIEIDFILKLSLFSNRTIPDIDTIKKIPFVFAGDEFQTINPTGFNWNLLRSYFTERLFAAVGLKDKIEDSKISEPNALSHNFRSSNSIVKFANRIQLLRAARFGQETQPQEAYFSRKGAPVFCLPIDDAVIKKLAEKKIRLIIPAREGQTVFEFIESTPLKGKITFTEDGVTTGMTILSPSQAKGLEYKNVAIFGFRCDDNNTQLKVNELKQWFEKNNMPDDNDIELKYLLSNAYVAATRAENKVYILDDFKNQDSFWGFAFANGKNDVEELKTIMLKKVKTDGNNIWSEDKIGYIEKGTIDDITGENENNNTAYEDNEIEKAMKSYDNDFIKQIAVRYKGRNSHIYNKLMARIKTNEGDYEKAADYYKKASLPEEAIKVYWTLLADVKEKRIIKFIVDCCSGSKNSQINNILKWCNKCFEKNNKLSDLTELIEYVNDENDDLSSWGYIISIILTSINTYDITKNNVTELSAIIHNLKKYERKGISMRTYTWKLAELLYVAEDYNNAVDLWEKIDPIKRPQGYYYSKIEITDYPEKLEFFEKANYHKDGQTWQTAVFSIFTEKLKEFPLEKLQEKYRRVIFKAITTKKDFTFYIAHILADVSNEDDYKIVCEKIRMFDISIDKNIIDALIYAKLNKLEVWKKPVTKGGEISLFFDMMFFLQSIRYNEKFEREINIARENQAIRIYFERRYQKRFNLLAPVNLLIAYEWGRLMESRGFFIDSIIYYEWLLSASKDTVIMDYAQKRWIYCKEKQAMYEASTKLYEEAADKREKQNLTDYIIEDKPTISHIQWTSIFEKALKISDNTQNEKNANNRSNAVGNNETQNDIDQNKDEKYKMAKTLKDAGHNMNIIMSTFNLTQEEFDNL